MLKKLVNRNNGYIFYFILLLLICFIGCGKDSKNPVKDDVQKTFFSKPPDPSTIITIETDEGGRMRVVGNNILIKVDTEAVDKESVEYIIHESGGELVGQIPELGMYQAEYPFSTELELNAKISSLSLNSNIQSATFNMIVSTRKLVSDKSYCQRDYDMHNLEDINKLPFEEIEYYSAVPIMGLVREHMTLKKVKVAVFDTELEVDLSREFNDVNLNIIDLGIDNIRMFEPHGTMVTGVIAADNKDGGVNGLASSLIEDKLELISVVTDTPWTAMQDIEAVFLVGSVEKMDICNMSSGYGGEGCNVSGIRNWYKWTFQHFSDILFVVAAGNEYFEISTINDAPAGIQLSNVITVAGTKYQDPTSACDWSSYGSLMDIAAPCEKIPVVDPMNGNEIKILDGNSFGTPMVASLAAVLKSINPNLSASKLKEYILDYSYTTGSSVSGRRLIFSLPIEQVLIDMNAPEAVKQMIDLVEPIGEGDAPGVVECRICSQSIIYVGGEDVMRCNSDSTNSGSVSDMGGMLMFTHKNQMCNVGFNTYNILTSALPIVGNDKADIKGNATVTYLNSNTGILGNSTSGELIISKAYISQRNPLNNNPMVINIEGEMSGMMEIIDNGQIKTRAFNGKINMILIVASNNEDFYNYFEEYCE